MRMENLVEKLNRVDGILLRKTTEQDQVFLKTLFCATREYLFSLPLPKAQLDFLVQQQFLLQQTSYMEQFPQALNCIIEHNGLPVGKLVLAETDQNVHIVDLALIPQQRGQGYGTGLLRQLQKHVGAENRMISLSVDLQNFHAQRFYRALGFKSVATSATHESMCWPY